MNNLTEGKTMKRFVILLFVLILSGCVVTRPAEEQTVEIEKVVDVDGMQKDEIYEGVKVWIANNFKSSKAVIEYDSKEQGTIIGNGNIIQVCESNCPGSDFTISFVMRVDIKDGKFKLLFNNLQQCPSYNTMTGFDKFNYGSLTDNYDLTGLKIKLMGFANQISNSITSKKTDW